jgi:hypothetical protein
MRGGTPHLGRSRTGRGTPARRLKKVLLSLMVAGALGSVTVHRTYAVFVSEERNSPATLSTGTLTLSSVVGAGAACHSYTGSGNVKACDALFTYSPATENYPGEPRTVKVALTNDGSLPATHLGIYSPGTCTKVDTADDTQPRGGGDPCAANGAQLQVQETASDGTTPVHCWYPLAAPQPACGSSYGDLAGFRTAYGATSLDMGAGPAAQGLRYFTLGVQLSATASDSLQGEGAQFTLAFHMTG